MTWPKRLMKPDEAGEYGEKMYKLSKKYSKENKKSRMDCMSNASSLKGKLKNQTTTD